MLADKGYDGEALRRYCDQYRKQLVAPLRSMKRKPKPGLPRLFNPPKNEQRNVIERMFGWLKKKPTDRDTFRQAREKLCRYSLAGLFHMLSATSLFVQNLSCLKVRVFNIPDFILPKLLCRPLTYSHIWNNRVRTALRSFAAFRSVLFRL